MFNLFKVQPDPIFTSLSTDNKQAIKIVYQIFVDADPKKPNKKIQQSLSGQYMRKLKIDLNDSSFFMKWGMKDAVKSLETLSKFQKEYLVALVCDLLRCNGTPTETELVYFHNVFKIMGIEQDELVNIMKNYQALLRQFT